MLLEFLMKYHAWIDAGAPEGTPFTRYKGLCGNMLRFSRFHGMEPGPAYNLVYDRLNGEAWPFGGKDRYDSDRRTGTMHLNKARVMWVREKIKELAK